MKKKSVSVSKDIGEGLGISGMTLGILGILFSGVIGIGISIPGLAFSIIQQKKNKTKIGFAGVVLNSVALIFSVVFLIFVYYQTKQLLI